MKEEIRKIDLYTVRVVIDFLAQMFEVTETFASQYWKGNE